MFIYSLLEKPEYIDTVASIYMQEWDWHFASEWNIHTYEEMKKDIEDNFLGCTYVALLDGVFIGTVAMFDSDLRSHEHLYPWVSSLYVIPSYRNKGIGKMLVDYATSTIQGKSYLWCYTEHERNLYERWGFVLTDVTQYDGKPAWVMEKQSFI